MTAAAAAAAAAGPRPSGYDITAETAGLELRPRRNASPSAARGEPNKLVLRFAVTETHRWLGIGGGSARLRRPRRLSRDKISLPLSTSCGGGGGPDYLRSAADCRRLIVQAARHEFRKEEDFRGLSSADWDQVVPRDVEARVVELATATATPGDGRAAFKCEVSIRVRVEFVYSEAAALLRACMEMEAAGDLDAAAPPCPICFEEMDGGDAEAEATRLPGCAHGFHCRCIGRWFQKASTCPVCRRDKLPYLPPEYRAVHNRILSGPEDSC